MTRGVAKPIGAVEPGPRGSGWRVKTAHGWEPCTKTGRPLRRRADPERLNHSQTLVLRTLAAYLDPLKDTTLASAVSRVTGQGLPLGTVQKRRHELMMAGLVECAGRGHGGRVYRVTSAGAAALARIAGTVA